MEINIGVNQPLEVLLPSYATCGYSYDIEAVNASGIVHIEKLQTDKYPRNAAFGASMPVSLRITGLKAGHISLKEIRPFEPDGEPGHIVDIIIS